MNLSTLKTFAREARQQLLTQVGARLTYVLTQDTAELRHYAPAIAALREAIDREGREHIIEAVAYTWFNRFAALRFMDVRGYLPLRIHTVSPAEGFTQPELLAAAQRHQLPEALRVDRTEVNELLDGIIPHGNPQEAAYQKLLVAVCNHYHSLMPFLFQPIRDYTELLLPQDLLAPQGVLAQLREQLDEEACQNVEVIGWLYQFYISEKKEAIDKRKDKVKTEEIPAVTQLFTPHWIVCYMVENSLGRLWLEHHPESKLREQMKYFVEERTESREQSVEISVSERAESEKLGPEDIRLIDPACGSGHILVYAFDLLAKIYEESGYTPAEIPGLILQHNLYGIDIDPRAAALAAFALMMKARAYQRRFFRKAPVVQPHIIALQDISFTEQELLDLHKHDPEFFTKAILETLQQWGNSTTFGSLIRPKAPIEHPWSQQNGTPSSKRGPGGVSPTLLLQPTLTKAHTALTQAAFLSPRYHCVVANPPYMGGGKMSGELKAFAKKNYPDSKADTFAMFMERGMDLLVDNGSLGMINQHAWMFLSSYEKLREKLLSDFQIESMLHLGPRAFDSISGEVVQTTAFTLRKRQAFEGIYFRLTEGKGEAEKERRFLDKSYGFFTADQRNFAKIPGSPIAYWVSERVVKVFEEGERLGNLHDTKSGMATCNNDRFMRLWSEVSFEKMILDCSSSQEGVISRRKWFPYGKGGTFRKWYGNYFFVVNWEDEGKEIKQFVVNNPKDPKTTHWSRRIFNTEYFFISGITFSDVSSGPPSFRRQREGVIFSGRGPMIMSDSDFVLGLLNSKVIMNLLKMIAPTLTYNIGDVSKIPLIHFSEKASEGVIKNIVKKNINISLQDWDAHETSWDHGNNELIRTNKEQGSGRLSEVYEAYKRFWSEKFFQLHAHEEDLNRIFIDIYGLEEELTPEVELSDITILQQELSRQYHLSAAAYEKMSVDDAILEKIRPLAGQRFYSATELNKALKARLDKAELKAAKTDIANSSATLLDENGQLIFNTAEVMRQLVSYAVGCMMGRYSLDKPGLILANQGQTLEDFLRIISEGEKDLPAQQENIAPDSRTPTRTQTQTPSFLPDDDNIIPVLAEDFFEDDIVARFKVWLRAAFGEAHYAENLAFIEQGLGRDMRSYFLKDFYADHVRRYKSRPIYWLFSSPEGSFQALVYLHRYRPDTLSRLLNEYLREYQVKLSALDRSLAQIELSESASAADKARAQKQRDKLRRSLDELQAYERDQLYPLATQRLELDLDDGVKVNYGKLGTVLAKVKGLNG